MKPRAFIKRHAWPEWYAGTNAQGNPVWTSAITHALDYDPAEVVPMLNALAKRDATVTAVIFPEKP